MTRKNVWVAGLAMPVMIAAMLLFLGTTGLAANDQPVSRKCGGQNR